MFNHNLKTNNSLKYQLVQLLNRYEVDYTIKFEISSADYYSSKGSIRIDLFNAENILLNINVDDHIDNINSINEKLNDYNIEAVLEFITNYEDNRKKEKTLSETQKKNIRDILIENAMFEIECNKGE